MINKIKVATENFFDSSLKLKLIEQNSADLINTHISYIFIEKDGEKREFYFFMAVDTINKIAKAFMIDDELDNELIEDIMQESANQIAGNAKLLLEESDKVSKYSLGIPKYTGLYSSKFHQDFKEQICYKVENSDIMIAMK